jgi:hypothetical protein
VKRYNVSVVEEAILRSHIRHVLQESQGVITQTITPTGVSPGYRPFGVAVGLAVASGMAVFTGIAGNAEIWKASGCVANVDWPISAATAKLKEPVAIVVDNYATALSEDVTTRFLRVIAACQLVHNNIGLGLGGTPNPSFVTVTYDPPSSTGPSSGKPTTASFTGMLRDIWSNDIYTHMSSPPTTGGQCNFQSVVAQYTNNDTAKQQLKLIAQAALQGAVSQMSQHIDQFRQLQASGQANTIKVGGTNGKDPVAHISDVLTKSSAAAKTLISNMR